MIIRKAQMEVLSAASRKTFEKNLVAHVQATWPDLAAELGREPVEGRVREGINRAEGYGITSEENATRFVEMLFRLSPAFDTAMGWAPRILTDETLNGTQKMDRIEAAANYELASRSFE